MGRSDGDRVQHVSERGRENQRREAPESAPAAAQRLGALIGNRAFTEVVARMGDGEGILAGGAVHPHVEAAIAARRGHGRSLPAALANRLERGFGNPISDVRIHADETANALARAVSARAFAMGTDIFFAHGEYRPGTPVGDQLIAHEVAHTQQQRGALATGPLTLSQPGDALEREADAIARDIFD